MNSPASDIAFTPAVKAIQARKGSRAAYARMETGAGWHRTITPELAQLIAEQTSVFLGTANAAGQPYIQHRGGPPGFLRVLDEKTIAFADFRGNRQFITLGNLAGNPRAFLFLIDYARRQRVKIWGEARVVEDDPRLLGGLDAGRLQGARRAGNPVPGRGVGRQLPAAYSTALRSGRCRAPSRRARSAHRRARNGSRAAEERIAAQDCGRSGSSCSSRRISGGFRLA